MNILFVTWDGPQVGYLESLFLPIFAGLEAHGVHFDVLQFRWGSAAGTERARAACEAAGVGYRAVQVMRTLGPAGPMLTALAGSRHVRKAVSDFGSDIIMPRCPMPAIPVLAAGGSNLRPLIFDADGFPADERVEMAGESRSGLTYKLFRHVEARTARASEAVLVRTPAAARVLGERARISGERIHVVANGRDEALFQPCDAESRAAVRRELGIDPAAPLLVYAGSIGPKYLFAPVRDFARALGRVRPDARLLVLTGSPELAHAALGADAPLSPLVMNVPPRDVGRYLAAADLGLAFYQDRFSTQAIAPLKVAEYLLCGVPVLGTAAVGPTQAALDAGMFLDESAGPEEAVRWLMEEILPHRESVRARARTVGTENFSLRRSVADYLRAIAGIGPATPPLPPSGAPHR